MAYLNQPHRTFELEFKVMVAKTYLSGEKSGLELASEYDLAVRMVRRWATEYRAGGEEALKDKRGKHGKNKCIKLKVNFNSELDSLRHENLQLKGELFLLKKLKEFREKQKK